MEQHRTMITVDNGRNFAECRCGFVTGGKASVEDAFFFAGQHLGVVEMDRLRGMLRAAAGYISNIADTLDEDHPEWSLEAAQKIASGDFSGPASWMNDTWRDY